MFKPKQKAQQKPKSSKSFSYNIIDSYYQKTKSTHFEIYLNSGVNDYDIEGQNIYASSVSIKHSQELLDVLVKGFSSIYQLDHKSFEWKDKVQSFVKVGREINKVIDKLKQEAKDLEQRKIKLQGMQIEVSQTLTKYNQLKLQHDQLLSQSHQEKTREENFLKMRQRLQFLQSEYSVFQEKSLQISRLSQENSILRQENNKFRVQIERLSKQNQQLKLYIRKIKDSSFGQQTIAQMTKDLKLNNGQTFQALNSVSLEIQEFPQSVFQSQILLNPFLSSKIISYLWPNTLTSLLSLTRTSRFFLFHSSQVIHAAFRSIVGYKNFEIAFFHRHIKHFQTQMKKIPEEIIQSTFYQFNILKQNVGGDFFAILNLCANIFQGKFSTQTTLNMSKTVKEYVQSKEILHYVESPKEQEFFLRIDKQLVKHFFEQRKVKKQEIMKEIQQMTQKISLAQRLYSVDNQTLTQFHTIISKHFTILFVLAKHLFAQSRSLQYLNGFLLSELNQITRFKIEKEYDLEDVKAELEAANKMCVFLSDKCNKSEERILRQNKEQLEMQRHVGKLAESIKIEQQKVKRLEKQLGVKDSQTKNIKEKYSELKSLYNSNKEKYNRLISQLATVKQTILNLN